MLAILDMQVHVLYAVNYCVMIVLSGTGKLIMNAIVTIATVNYAKFWRCNHGEM